MIQNKETYIHKHVFRPHRTHSCSSKKIGCSIHYCHHRPLNSHNRGVNESVILDSQQILQSAWLKLITISATQSILIIKNLRQRTLDSGSKQFGFLVFFSMRPGLGYFSISSTLDVSWPRLLNWIQPKYYSGNHGVSSEHITFFFRPAIILCI